MCAAGMASDWALKERQRRILSVSVNFEAKLESVDLTSQLDLGFIRWEVCSRETFIVGHGAGFNV